MIVRYNNICQKNINISYYWLLNVYTNIYNTNNVNAVSTFNDTSVNIKVNMKRMANIILINFTIRSIILT